jgi:hypothetical protein
LPPSIQSVPILPSSGSARHVDAVLNRCSKSLSIPMTPGSPKWHARAWPLLPSSRGS